VIDHDVLDDYGGGSTSPVVLSSLLSPYSAGWGVSESCRMAASGLVMISDEEDDCCAERNLFEFSDLGR
jgi:hypothetical protein